MARNNGAMMYMAGLGQPTPAPGARDSRREGGVCAARDPQCAVHVPGREQAYYYVTYACALRAQGCGARTCTPVGA